MRRVFVDTGAFYAVLNRTDQHHREAARPFEQAVTEAWRLLTSNFIVAETHALVLTRLGRDLAADWLRDVPAAVIRVTEQDEAKAKQIIFGYRDKEFSYCDATSFAVMERLRLRQVMAFDPHFAQYGKFTTVRPAA
ncbi:MAG TPA: PIN domain-containing protein [Candidatus Binatia bacterium]|jgi:predicted nucleic acid-binding protein|nr:PIN domain-containing protein [Candidatus Binatia bacterium]